MKTKFLIAFLFASSFISISSVLKHSGKADLKKEVQEYLDEYNRKYKALSINANESDWRSQTNIVEGDSSNAIATRKAKEEYARFTGSIENINKARKFLQQKDQLTPIQIKQLERVLYLAGNNPENIAPVVKERIKAETEQTEKLFGYDFKIDGQSVTPNDIDNILGEEADLNKRLKAWEASKMVGKGLKSGLVNLRDLRNKTVQGLGYSDFFSYQVSDYGMTTAEMNKLLEQINKELYPLYKELHTYARYELAKKYNVKEVPDQIPAHWLANRWGQDWTDMIDVEGLNIDSAIKLKDREWVIKQGERFYTSLGYPALPQSFWTKSSLYPVPADAKYKKNTHASAWHMDYERDVRCLMSIIPNAEWYETSHHELGHIYYYLTYSNPDVPLLLREGANRAYHEALGSLMGLASLQKPFLANLDLVSANAKTDEVKTLLKEALHYVVFIPWSAGVMSNFEHDLYAKNLPTDQFNKHWWTLVQKYQGITTSAPRGEEYCDAATKTHINDDPAQYYDYALSYVLLFQLHDHIANKILKQDPHSTNYYGNKEVGTFLQDMMYPGASRDWRTLLREKTGEDLSARAMVKYFSPLMDFLKKENAGRKYTLAQL